MAGKYNFLIEQGATFHPTLTWYTDETQVTPVDLSGYTARMDIRDGDLDGDVLVSLTSGGGITLGGAAGTIAILISDTDTAALDFDAGVYDLELESAGGETTRLMQGNVKFSREVTR